MHHVFHVGGARFAVHCAGNVCRYSVTGPLSPTCARYIVLRLREACEHCGSILTCGDYRGAVLLMSEDDEPLLMPGNDLPPGCWIIRPEQRRVFTALALKLAAGGIVRHITSDERAAQTWLESEMRRLERSSRRVLPQP